MTTPQSISHRCENAQCPRARIAWLWRWRRPPGIRLNDAWYCSLECFEQGALELFSQLNLKASRGRAIRYRLPLGLLLLSKGLISAEHLQDALKAQKESQKGRLGDWLRQHGILTEEQLTGALGVQWGLPVFHLAQSSGFAECAAMAPVHLMEASRMALVHYMPTSRNLYVAFSDGIDFAALRALEQMIECSTQPCVIGETEMEEALDAMRRMPRPSETVLDGDCAPKSLATTTREWAESNKADQVRAVVASESLWVRLESSSLTGHLLFKLPEAVPELVL
ncbi:MAG: hypothetical protein ACRD2G_01620 [Terriglobia bacterium]